MSNRKTTVETLGCRLNEYESVAMSEIAEGQGLDNTIIVNTCAVTAEAVRKSRQAVRSASRRYPNARLVVTGCAAQIDAAGFAGLEGVDALVGNGRKLDPEIWKRIAARKTGNEDGTQVLVDDVMAARHPSNHLISSFGKRARAHIQVQNGCDHRCTFCVIPFGRGNSRSVPDGEVIAQVRRLVDQGFSEIVLSGVDLTSWGRDLAGNPGLGYLVERILAEEPNLPRLRLSSIDVIEIDEKLVDLLGTEQRLMPHLHLSLQAGHNMILKRMKRRHSREDAIRVCGEIRDARPEIAFGADLIAGFPTESDEMFESTMGLVDECGLTWLHVFPYSRRDGTPAARMPQVDPAAIKRRAARLRELARKRVLVHLSSRVGMSGNVLVETPRSGRTEQFAEVVFDSDMAVGSIRRAEFTGIEGNRLAGRLAGSCSGNG